MSSLILKELRKFFYAESDIWARGTFTLTVKHQKTMISTVILLIFIYFNFKIIASQDLNNDDYWSLNNLIPTGYNKYMVPMINGSPTRVYVGIEVDDLVNVIESGQVCFCHSLYRSFWISLDVFGYLWISLDIFGCLYV